MVMNERRFVTGLAAAAMVAGATDASAQQARGFGDKGELILSADRLVPVFSHATESVTPPPGPRTTTTRSSSSLLFGRDVGFGSRNPHTIPRVGVDYTVIDRLTLGGAAALAFTVDGGPESTTAFGLAPRVGYILPVTSVIGFWFRGGFAYYSVRTREQQVGGDTDHTVVSNSTFSLDLDPQLVVVPYQHFFFTVGPLVNIPLSGARSTETVSRNGTRVIDPDSDLSIFHFGIHAGLGGWFNL
jgi:hypothetical protein